MNTKGLPVWVACLKSSETFVSHRSNVMDFPIHKKPLPQIWIEDDHFVIESETFRYVINASNRCRRKSGDPVAVLFKLCRRMKPDAIAATY